MNIGKKGMLVNSICIIFRNWKTIIKNDNQKKITEDEHKKSDGIAL
jgi:hypothetical protein